MDLIAWTRGGSIPAAVLERYLAPLALTHAGAVTLRMARLAKQPSEGLLHAHAVKLAERLGLSLRLPAEETLIPRRAQRRHSTFKIKKTSSHHLPAPESSHICLVVGSSHFMWFMPHQLLDLTFASWIVSRYS